MGRLSNQTGLAPLASDRSFRQVYTDEEGDTAFLEPCSSCHLPFSYSTVELAAEGIML
jgi:hypothetical protein